MFCLSFVPELQAMPYQSGQIVSVGKIWFVRNICFYLEVEWVLEVSQIGNATYAINYNKSHWCWGCVNFLVGTHNYQLQPCIQLRILKGDTQKVFVVFFWFLHLHREPANPAEVESTTHIATRETASSQTKLRNNPHISDIFIIVIFITKTKTIGCLECMRTILKLNHQTPRHRSTDRTLKTSFCSYFYMHLQCI